MLHNRRLPKLISLDGLKEKYKNMNITRRCDLDRYCVPSSIEWSIIANLALMVAACEQAITNRVFTRKARDETKTMCSEMN